MSKIIVHGKGACTCQAGSLPMIESRLRGAGLIKKDLSGLITQGAYSSGVAASAGTHDGGGVWDVKMSLVDTSAKRRIWRQSGVAMWFRTTSDGFSSAHGHGVWIGCGHLASLAESQVAQYKQGRNGLKGRGEDRGPRVAFITWQKALSEFNKAGETRPDAGAILAPATVQLAAAPPVVDAIPRVRAPRPFATIVVDGIRGEQTLKRLQAQLNVAQSGKLDHFTIRALKVWLGNPDDARGVLSTHNVKQLQFRVGLRNKDKDGDWGMVTTRALQVFLNDNV